MLLVAQIIAVEINLDPLLFFLFSTVFHTSEMYSNSRVLKTVHIVLLGTIRQERKHKSKV